MNRKKYLKGLEDEHYAVKRLFTELEDIVERKKISDVKALKEKFARLKDMLVEHVHSEDEVFYKDLRAKAVDMDQDALIPALDFFRNSMHKVTGDVDAFFKEYADEKDILENTGRFADRFKAIRDEILQRIASEEGSLFYIYRAYFFDE
ncbi:MAG: hemerythrin domain-containing protein [Deltaproteobacteria bacterium]|nr:hemerythrin domain-containing protein [Deltaproteobacteria bacterium]